MAVLLDDCEFGADLTELLEPFADRLAVAVRGLVSYGSIVGLSAAWQHWREITKWPLRVTGARSSSRSARDLGDAPPAPPRRGAARGQAPKLLERLRAEASGFGMSRVAEPAAELAASIALARDG